jgi:hypothetical protein
MRPVCDIRIFDANRVAPPMGPRPLECGRATAQAERPESSLGHPEHMPTRLTGGNR